MAYIRAEEIERYVVPWFSRVKAYMKSQKTSDGNDNSKPRRLTKTQNQELRGYLTRPGGPMAIDMPESLLEKIHLYNVMLQLGLPKFVQLPLIDALVLQMYQTNLSACHLDTLEITIGRFYSQGLAILDPVLNHLIGTYALRSPSDRSNPEPPGSRKRKRMVNISRKTHSKDLVRADSSLETKSEEEKQCVVKFSQTKRRYLEFVDQKVRRGKFGKDTYVLPPKLAVLGHCIKHWSGVRADGSTAPIYTGFPLNVGRYTKFIRRDVSIPVDVEDCEEVQTNRLIGQDYYHNHGPGKQDGLPEKRDSDKE